LCCSVEVANAKMKIRLAQELGAGVDDPRVAAQLQPVTLVEPPCRRGRAAGRRPVISLRK
jgi:hypothetical protein